MLKQKEGVLRHSEGIRQLKYFDFINDQHLWPFVLRNNHARKYFTTIEELGPNRLQYQTINDLLTLKYAPGHENYNYPNLI